MKNQDKVKSETNIKKEDLENLGEKAKNLRSDGGADKVLSDRKEPVDFEGSDLDVPGRTLPDKRNPRNIKDEEN